MKRYIKCIMVVVLTIFATSCQKDDDSLFVDSIAELNNTFWVCNRDHHIAIYDDNGVLIRELPDDSGDTFSGSNVSYVYLANDRFCTFYEMIGNPIQRFVYTDNSYVYNSYDRILKAGDKEYELLEMSNTRLKLRYKEARDSKTYVYTEVYEPWSGDNKTWAEWVEYMNSENAKLQ